MPNLKWSKLSHLQLGRYAEYYTKMEFTSYGYDVYTSEVDDHGIDFVAQNPTTKELFYVQVKSVRKHNYTYLKKDKLTLSKNFLVCLIYFTDDKLPDLYIIPSMVWQHPNEVFVDREYNGMKYKSKPEWGINYSQKNSFILEAYRAEKNKKKKNI